MKPTDKPLPPRPSLSAYLRGHNTRSQSSSVYSETVATGNSPELVEKFELSRRNTPPERPPRPAHGLWDNGGALDSMTEYNGLHAQIHDLEVEKTSLLQQLSDMQMENLRLKKAVDQSMYWQSTAEETQKTLKDIMGYVVLVVSENRQRLKDARADLGSIQGP